MLCQVLTGGMPLHGSRPDPHMPISPPAPTDGVAPWCTPCRHLLSPLPLTQTPHPTPAGIFSDFSSACDTSDDLRHDPNACRYYRLPNGGVRTESDIWAVSMTTVDPSPANTYPLPTPFVIEYARTWLTPHDHSMLATVPYTRTLDFAVSGDGPTYAVPRGVPSLAWHTYVLPVRGRRGSNTLDQPTQYTPALSARWPHSSHTA
jgi:hypothetical protein